MNLRNRLGNCDPNSATSLRELYDGIQNCPDLEIKLARLCSEPDLETCASWLVKHHIERGYRPNRELSRKLLQAFLDMNAWPARLHLLQIFQHLSVPPDLVRPVREFTLQLSGDRNKFVRAWSFSALHCIALAYPEFKPETSRMIQWAAENEAPSVKARLRKPA